MRLKNMKLIQYLLVNSIGLLLFACTETDGLETHAGKTGFMISLADGSVGVEARAVPSALPDPAKTAFQIQVLKAGTAASVADGHYEENQLIEVAAGVYDVVATYGDVSTLALDKPCYRGIAEDQTVSVDKTTSVTINCTVANALLSVKYDDSVKKFSDIYSDYYVKVSVNGASLDIKDTEKSAYFQPETSFEVYFCATKKDENEEKSMKLNLSQTSLKAAEHLILTLSPEPDKSGADISVTKEEIKSVTINETIPMEWLPKPKVTAEGFDENNTLTFVETETKEAKLNLELSSALQDVTFKFNFQDEQFAELRKDKEYLWSNAEDKQVITETLGIAVSDANINLNGLLAKLQTNVGESTANTIDVDVKANNRWSSEDEKVNTTYTITCNKPVFSVDAYPGNIWTKEFTMNALREEQVTSGDFLKLSENMKYQFSTDNSTWKDLDDDLRAANLTQGTTYYIRGLYRDVIPSKAVEVKTYEAIELTNGGLENPEVLDGDDSGVRRGTVYGWDGWATLNKMSTPSGLASYSFNSRSGCRPTTDSHTGNAIRVITLGYGIGGWAKPTSAMHSKLYLGESADEDGNGIVYGIRYESRPSHLKFWYKCVSNKGNDESLVQIQLLHDDVVLGEGEFRTGAKDAYEEKTIEVDYTNYASTLVLAPNKLVIVFQSGTKESLDVDDDLKSFISGWNTVDKTADATYRGNELYVDDVELIYDK